MPQRQKPDDLRNFIESEGLEQSQHLHILSATIIQPRFQQTTQLQIAVGQLPAARPDRAPVPSVRAVQDSAADHRPWLRPLSCANAWRSPRCRRRWSLRGRSRAPAPGDVHAAWAPRSSRCRDSAPAPARRPLPRPYRTPHRATKAGQQPSTVALEALADRLHMATQRALPPLATQKSAWASPGACVSGTNISRLRNSSART